MKNRYNEDFRVGQTVSGSPNDITQTRQYRAWEKAWEIRTFEIEMYWKRATYFWAFQIALFAGYGAFIDGNSIQSFIGAVGFAFLGVLLACCWVLVNKGSRFWQENWEAHIDELENEITGPLYKTIMMRGEEPSYSVSKINMFVSKAFTVAWGIALICTILLHDLSGAVQSACFIRPIPVAFILAVVFYAIRADFFEGLRSNLNECEATNAQGAANTGGVYLLRRENGFRETVRPL